MHSNLRASIGERRSSPERRRRGGWRAAFTFLAVAAIGCGPPTPDRTISGRWVRYHHWADETPCDEAVARLEALAEFITSRFGLAPRPVDYVKLRTTQVDALRGYCAHNASACADGTFAYSTGWAHDHEVVHAVFAPVGSPPPLFQEGVAEVFGCGSTRTQVDVDSTMDFERLLSSDAWNRAYPTAEGGAAYRAAGSFVRFLLDAHGEAAFVGFYAKAPHDGGDGARAAFRRAFGQSVDEALAAWRASDPEHAGSYCILEADPCDAAPALEQTGPGQLDVPLTCLGSVTHVRARASDAMAIGVTSSLRPATVVVRTCQPSASFRDEVVIPPDVPGLPFRPSLSSLGRTLELRTFGAGLDWVVEARTAEVADFFSGPDPETSSVSAPWDPRRAGSVTVRTLADPARLWTQDCDAGATPLGGDAWGFHLSAPVTAIPADGGVLRLHAAQPLVVQGLSTDGTIQPPRVTGGACGGTSAPDSLLPQGPQSDLTLEVPAVKEPARFSITLPFAN